MSEYHTPQTPPRILFVSHAEKQCGVHEYGLNVERVLRQSQRYSFVYVECSTPAEFHAAMQREKPSAVIYNYVFKTLPWIRRRHLTKYPVPHIAIIHEGAQEAADAADGLLFDYHISHDPTLLLHNPLVFKTGRIIPRYVNSFPEPAVPTIGSFGFGLEGKGFDTLIQSVQQQFDKAVIRLHIPFNSVVDVDGKQATETAQRCRALVTKPGIELKLSHDYLSNEALLDFLAQNTLNAFFYARYPRRGVSSVVDYALAVRRPLAVSKSEMFRHVHTVKPSICFEDTPLCQIIANGLSPLEPLMEDWTEGNFIWDYERILDKVLYTLYPRRKPPTVRSFVRAYLGRHDLLPSQAGDKRMKAPATNASTPVSHATAKAPTEVQGPIRYNRILDNAAREQYSTAIEALWTLVPEMMARKLAAANIQQAFVFDTVRRIARSFSSPKILCVGGYEDTASAGLAKGGLPVEDIDPVLNYDLDTFINKPTTRSGSYHIIFSTSVIEHVENDEQFVRQIVGLLAPGGMAVLTCDFNDLYRPGDKIPVEDFRFYTQRDFRERLLAADLHCTLVDEPEWNCPSPDFEYSGCRYTFASFVIRKNES